MIQSLFLSAFLRSSAVSFSAVMLALFLSAKGYGVGTIGILISLGLLGQPVMTALVVRLSRYVSLKALLWAAPLCMAAGGWVYAEVDAFWVLAAFTFLGMVNGMGRDNGPSATLEQACLPACVPDEERTSTYAWYNVCVDAGHAFGSLAAALPAVLRSGWNLPQAEAYRLSWHFYAVLCLAASLVWLGSRGGVTAALPKPAGSLSPATKPLLRRFVLLSGLDSFGGGFLTTALLSYFFFKRFGSDESLLGPLFFAARLLNIVSHLAAARLAKKIGLLRTMVFTHLPASLILMTIPFMPSFGVAVLLFLVRESLVEMDVPTRQSYLAAIVKPEERTRAAGYVNITRSAAWSAAPSLAGLLGSWTLSLPVLVGPGLKVVYDLLLYKEFRKVRPPEEVEVRGER